MKPVAFRAFSAGFFFDPGLIWKSAGSIFLLTIGHGIYIAEALPTIYSFLKSIDS